MKTYEMIAKAEADGKTYRSGEMLYNRNTGFTSADPDDNGGDWPATAWADRKGKDDFKIRQGLYRFAHCGNWKLVDDEPEADESEKVVTISADELCAAVAEVTYEIVGGDNIRAAAPFMMFGAKLATHIFDKDESEEK